MHDLSPTRFYTEFLRDLLARWTGWPEGVIAAIGWVVGCAVLGLIMMVTTMLLIWAERKVSAWIQSRLGPTQVGPAGIVQTLADGIKLFQKEDIIPAAADRKLFTLAPLVCFTCSLVALVVIPWDRDAIGSDISIGVLFIIAAASINVLGILMASWGSNNKWALLGGMRSAAQLVSYEIPQALAIIAVIMTVGTLSLRDMGEQQAGWLGNWNVFRYWLMPAALLYFVAGIAEVNRTPFDLPEAESELVAGFHTEYSGMKFGFFFLGEYINAFIVGLVFATMFLGGWNWGIPALDRLAQQVHMPGFVAVYVKAWAVVLLMMWVRWTLPRLRVDQLMAFAWKLLIPAGLLLLAGTGLVLLLGWTY